jgi:hypothetical protein
MRIVAAVVLACALAVVVGCATVDVTKTAKGFYAPTDPNEVEILATRPERKFVELGTVSTFGHQGTGEAKMHNALRAKTAPLGANAVILLNSGVDQNGRIWARGVAIRYGEPAAAAMSPSK